MKEFKKILFKQMGLVIFEALKKYEDRIEELSKENLMLKEQFRLLSLEVKEVDTRYKNVLKKVEEYLKSLERGLTLLHSNSLIDDLKAIIMKKK